MDSGGSGFRVNHDFSFADLQVRLLSFSALVPQIFESVGRLVDTVTFPFSLLIVLLLLPNAHQQSLFLVVGWSLKLNRGRTECRMYL